MADDVILRIVRGFLEIVRARGIPVELGVLFGSRARGAGTTESDIDLLVVSSRFDGPRSRDDIAALWRIAARVDSRIEPIPCGSRQWREDQVSPLLTVVRQQGEAVAI